MNHSSVSEKTARFALLTALALVLGLLDRAVPLSALLGGFVPGIKLGLANTVLLYAVYLMNWKSAVLLMLTKVLLSGFLFGSLNAILYSLSGGVLSLAVMLLVKRHPRMGALCAAVLALGADAVLLMLHPSPEGHLLWVIILILAAGLACLASLWFMRRFPDHEIWGTSIAGAVAHNIGQVLTASIILRTPRLLTSYLPILIGVGAAVGCLTGLTAARVFRALRLKINT